MEASQNFFDEYINFINDLQNQIMKIQLKYNECQMLIKKDYESGFIVKEVAEKMLAVKINQFVPSIDKKYRLSKAEIDLVNQYAALDNSGNILATILKPEYLEKAEVLELISKSVQTYDFYENMDATSKRIKLKADLTTAFEKRISGLKGKLSSLIRKQGENSKNTLAYQQIIDEINRCVSTIEFFDEIMDYDDQKLIQVITTFYKVDYSYYEWYKLMELKDLKEHGDLYTEHTKTMERAYSYNSDLIDRNDKIKELNEKVVSLNQSLSQFLTSVLDFDLSEPKEEKKKGLFRKAKKYLNNKEDLKELFTSLALLPGVTNYLKDIYYKDEETIELSACFDRYFEKNYDQEVEYVELERFLLDFKKNIIAYYKEELEKQQKELTSLIKLNNGTTIALTKNIEKGYSEAQLQERANNITNIDPSLLQIDGFTDDELEMMYFSLRDILTDNYSFQQISTNKSK